MTTTTAMSINMATIIPTKMAQNIAMNTHTSMLAVMDTNIPIHTIMEPTLDMDINTAIKNWLHMTTHIPITRMNHTITITNL
jgi:hypothetical protein